jgi:predicted ferric reductase
MKVMGDYTRHMKQFLKVGTTIAITSAYGTLTMVEGGPKQIWIAGGIGVTPFLAQLRSHAELDQKIDFYYSFRNEKDAVHLSLLSDISKTYPQVNMHLHDAKKQGYLSFKGVKFDEDTEVYLCGPRLMVASLIKQIKASNPGIKIDYEAFTFMGTLVDDAVRYVKMIWQWLTKPKDKVLR